MLYTQTLVPLIILFIILFFVMFDVIIRINNNKKEWNKLCEKYNYIVIVESPNGRNIYYVRDIIKDDNFLIIGDEMIPLNRILKIQKMVKDNVIY